VELTVHVSDTTHAAVGAAVNTLLDALEYDALNNARGELRFTPASGNARAIRGVLDGEAKITGLGSTGDIPSNAADVTFTLVCNDPSWYNPTAVTVTGAFDDATPVALSCANAGAIAAYPVITYTQAAGSTTVKPKVTDAYGRILEMDMTLAASSSLVMTLDPSAYTFLYTVSGGTTSQYDKKTAASQMISVKPGTNNLTFVATSGTATISVAYNARYTGAR
jgi:hypothetical protein